MITVRIFCCVPEAQDARDLDLAWTLLDESERERATRFRFDRDRIAHVTAHGMLRAVLARYAGAQAADLRFVTGRYGRPELVGAPQRPAIRFSLAHTRGLVGCAVTTDHDVGLDLEQVRLPAPLEVADPYFSPTEVTAMRALPSAERADRFYQLWTLKESYLKGRGLGLNMPLDAFSITPAAEGNAHLTLVNPEEDPGPWTFRCWRLPAHHMALAVRAEDDGLCVVVAQAQRIQDLVTDAARS